MKASKGGLNQRKKSQKEAQKGQKKAVAKQFDPQNTQTQLQSSHNQSEPSLQDSSSQAQVKDTQTLLNTLETHSKGTHTQQEATSTNLQPLKEESAHTPSPPPKHHRMLFGVKLQNEVYPPWREYYIDYEKLKKLLKENIILSEAWSDKDENKFVSLLDQELERVYSFEKEQYQSLDLKIQELESKIESYAEQQEQKKFDLKEFQSSLENLLSFTQELDRFSRLNFTGFLKIVKKHDRLHKHYSVKALLNVRLKNLPFHSEDYSPYIYRISILYQFLRENFESSSISTSLNDSVNKLSSTGKVSGSTPTLNPVVDNSFQVLKFWVHPENLMEIKTTILRHLPVLIYNNNSEDDYDDENTQDPTITSLYFDNPHFELYNMKLLKNLNKTPSLRIKWTGKLKNNPELTVERKFFNYDTGESDDTRISLKQKYINDFINLHDEDDFDSVEVDGKTKRKHNLDKILKNLKKRNLPKDLSTKIESDFKAIHEFIASNDLQPVLRTVFTRTAFQIPGDDNNLRITIDSNILFIREDSFDKDRPIRDLSNWHRTDLDDSNLKDTYSVLRKGEFVQFPYCVMEIKIKNSILRNKSSKTFKWVTELTDSHLVKEVPNFSKFIQGISSLFLEDDNLDILPFWLPELENDIRKKPEELYRETKLKNAKLAKENNNLKLLKSPNLQQSTTYLGKIEELIDDDDFDLEDHESSDDEEDSPTIQQTASSNNVHTVASSMNSTYQESDEETDLPPGVTKPIQLLRQTGPLKIEPKVYLANERTYLRWNHVVTYLTILTITLLNSSNASNFSGVLRHVTILYLILTLFITGWSYYIWNKRMSIIKQRSGKHLDAVLGPVVLAIGLVGILLTNFVLGWKNIKSQPHVTQMEFQSDFNKWILDKIYSFVDLF